MEQKAAVRKCYDTVSRNYGDSFCDELNHKPIDRLLLTRLVSENPDDGLLLDLACGPGHASQFLRNAGASEVIGIDLSEKLIEYAKGHDQYGVSYETGDILHLRFTEAEVSSIICLYGIVHFRENELTDFFAEVHRVLRPGGQFLLSFHVGEGKSELTEFLGSPVDITFYYFQVDDVLELLRKAGFVQKDVILRHPYPEEHPTLRAYLLVQKDSL